MDEKNFITVSREGFDGKAREDWLACLDEGRLSRLREEVETATDRVLARGRHQVVVLDFEHGGRTQAVAVKYFGRQPGWKDRYDRRRGSKAARSFQAAIFLQSQGIATPSPLAYFERWEGNRLVESFYLSAYLGELQSFKSKLLQLYESNGPCADLVNLLKEVGATMRRMHDAGFCHRDLGNQNIELLLDQASGQHEVYFLDLNRSRIREKLSLRERAQDFSRLQLTSAFLEILIRIYWESKTPAGFAQKVAKQRRHFRWWQNSRRLRHPIKSLRKARKNRNRPASRQKDIWIWDDRSAQASIIHKRADRRKNRSWMNHGKIAFSSIRAIWAIRQSYQAHMERAFRGNIAMSDRVGMSLEPNGLDFERQMELLGQLGKIPVLLRFGHHEGKTQWDRTLGYVDQLHRRGHPIMLAILQDRRAVLEPESWTNFLEYLFKHIAGKVQTVEIGHVINRVKWGIHNLKEYRELMRSVVTLREQYPEIQIAGPACIDFEPHHTLAALDNLPHGLRLSALSHHLYVDRRGAPENRQGPFGTVEKAALVKAVATHSKRCGDSVIVSEVNWPLLYTGEWSPVAASYMPKDAKGSRVHVSEEQYGCFMIRYLALVLCSGFVERVYWWRLVAHGFGLVDELDSDGWRERIAFKMLRTFLHQLGQATFVEKLETPEGVYALRFERQDDQVVLLWCNGRKYNGPWPLCSKRALDAEGRDIELSEVGEEPIYLVAQKQVEHPNRGVHSAIPRLSKMP